MWLRSRNANAYSSADLLEAMLASASLRLTHFRVDGGATSNDWLMQFHADLLGVPVERPDCVETTALGAAAPAGLAVGVWPSVDAFTATRRLTRLEPRSTTAERERGIAGWRRAVDAALYWAGCRPS